MSLSLGAEAMLGPSQGLLIREYFRAAEKKNRAFDRFKVDLQNTFTHTLSTFTSRYGFVSTFLLFYTMAGAFLFPSFTVVLK